MTKKLKLEEVRELVVWAYDLSMKYDYRITGIVDTFIKASEYLEDISQAKMFVENELKLLEEVMESVG